MENDTCREILGTYQYTTSATEQHPEGIPLESTMFSRMYGNEVTGITIEAGKTGYTDEAGHCLVSYATDADGKQFIAVTAKGPTYWRAGFRYVRHLRSGTRRLSDARQPGGRGNRRKRFCH